MQVHSKNQTINRNVRKKNRAWSYPSLLPRLFQPPDERAWVRNWITSQGKQKREAKLTARKSRAEKNHLFPTPPSSDIKWSALYWFTYARPFTIWETGGLNISCCLDLCSRVASKLYEMCLDYSFTVLMSTFLTSNFGRLLHLAANWPHCWVLKG